MTTPREEAAPSEPRVDARVRAELVGRVSRAMTRLVRLGWNDGKEPADETATEAWERSVDEVKRKVLDALHEACDAAPSEVRAEPRGWEILTFFEDIPVGRIVTGEKRVADAYDSGRIDSRLSRTITPLYATPSPVERAGLEQALRRVEWIGSPKLCPACGQYRDLGDHLDDCTTGRALAPVSPSEERKGFIRHGCCDAPYPGPHASACSAASPSVEPPQEEGSMEEPDAEGRP